MIVKAKYKSQEGVGDYILLILQPLWQNRIHAMSLNEVPVFEFLKFQKTVGQRLVTDKILSERGVNQLDIRKASAAFYRSNLKQRMDANLNNSYRTFDPVNFSSIQIVEYNFE